MSVRHLVVLLLVGAACGDRERSAGIISAASGAQRSATSSQDRRTDVNAGVNNSRRTALVAAADRVAPAVVSISVTSRRRVTQSPWDFFFVPPDAERLVQGYGTGFIIRADGIIVTNQHVVGGAEQIVVSFRDGTDAPAKLLGEDATTDVAVLKVNRSGLPVAPSGRSTDLMIGEWVMAVGNPFTYLLGNSEPTVTVGVVSATGRNILPSGEQAGLYLDMIQTDAAINPGNSGGPLTNALGEVVGVNSSIFSQSGGSIGLGFAIPIERALRVADEIVRNGAVRRAWTGLDVTGAEAMRDWKTRGGVQITSVAPSGPADRAGLKAGDVMIEANGRRLRNYLDWEAVKLDLHVGDTVRVRARDDGKTTTRVIVSGDLPTATAEKVTVLRDLELVTLTPAIQAEQQIRTERGALIFKITSQVAQATGLQRGDVIVGINRTLIRSAEQVGEIFDQMRSRTPLRIYFERDGRVAYTEVMFR